MDNRSLDQTIRWAIFSLIAYFIIGAILNYMIGAIVGLLIYRYYLQYKFK